MRKLLIERLSDDCTQTLGKLSVIEDCKTIFTCHTLELTWKNNKTKVSCIPKGTYDVVKRWSPRFKNHFHITEVKDRTFILIHPGNYHNQILGCVLVGKDLIDINGDGLKDVTSSKDTLEELLALMPQKFTLTIQ